MYDGSTSSPVHIISGAAQSAYGSMSENSSGHDELEHFLGCIPLELVHPDKMDTISVKSVFSIAYAFVMLAGIVGNGLVLYGLVREQGQFSVRKVFVLNLCLADVMIDLVALPFSAVTGIMRKWPFDLVACRLVGFLQATSVFSSSLTLTMIALDRYFLIVRPHLFNPKSYHFAICVIVLWLFSLLLASPMSIFAVVIEPDGYCDLKICKEDWLSYGHLRRAYAFTATGIQYGTPLVLTSLCYSLILRQIDRQIAMRKNHELILASTERRLCDRRRRTNRMTAAMVLSFMVAWLPLNVFNIYTDLTGYPASEVTGLSVHCIAMISTVTNPIIYSWLDPSFQKTLRRVIGRSGPGGQSNTGTLTAL